jgi:hypothetical protein
MKKLEFKNISVLLLFLSTLLISCEDVVDVELNDENIDLFSVEAYINTKQIDNVFVKIEKSLPVTYAEQNPVINNALVEISDTEPTPNKIILVEDSNTGIYKLPLNSTFRAVPNRTYKLTITTPEGIVISGEDYLQKAEPLDSTKVNLSARGNFEFLAVFINSQETPGLGNYYKWDIYINDVLLNKSEQMAFVSDELVDGNYVADFEIFTDFIEEDEEKVLLFGDTVYVEQLSISKSAYEFYIGMANQAFTGSPFSVPPANVSGNLTASNGKKVLGLFTASDNSVGNKIIIDSTNYTPLIPGTFYQE